MKFIVIARSLLIAGLTVSACRLWRRNLYVLVMKTRNLDSQHIAAKNLTNY